MRDARSYEKIINAILSWIVPERHWPAKWIKCHWCWSGKETLPLWFVSWIRLFLLFVEKVCTFKGAVSQHLSKFKRWQLPPNCIEWNIKITAKGINNTARTKESRMDNRPFARWRHFTTTETESFRILLSYLLVIVVKWRHRANVLLVWRRLKRIPIKLVLKTFEVFFFFLLFL